MVEISPEVMPHTLGVLDDVEIPAYVIRPPRPRGTSYHAPRLSRTSLRELRDQRRSDVWGHLVGGWRMAWSAEQVVVGPVRSADAPAADDARDVGVLRYETTVRVLPAGLALAQDRRPRLVSPRRLSQLGFGVATVVMAAGLGWGAGTNLPAPAAQPLPYIPASTLIATQNLPLKLPVIERQAGGGHIEQGHRSANVEYVVGGGDSFASIGQKFGLRPRTVRLVNQLPMGFRLKSGQKLTITPFDGAYHRVRSGETVDQLAERYGVAPLALRAHNPELKDEALVADRTLFIPGATELRYPEARDLKERGYRPEGPWAKRMSTSRSLLGQFGHRVGELAWPAHGQLSSPFGIRGYSFHPGVDICNSVGTTIRAAKSGTIVSAGWMGAYGYAVDIDHGGGVITRYGHCSKLLVTAGQAVEGGQEIAKMGSTGRSTGPHVHFEVRLQGRAVNPAGFF